MDNELIRDICLQLPYVTETVNWGHHLVFWVGDKAIGGKMFALINLDQVGTGVVWFHCGPDRFSEILEMEGIVPAPYMAKAYWVTVERWNVFRPGQWEEEMQQAHELVYEKLPPRTKAVLALPEKERLRAIRERRKLLEEKEKEKAEKQAAH